IHVERMWNEILRQARTGSGWFVHNESVGHAGLFAYRTAGFVSCAAGGAGHELCRASFAELPRNESSHVLGANLANIYDLGADPDHHRFVCVGELEVRVIGLSAILLSEKLEFQTALLEDSLNLLSVKSCV